MQTQDQTGRVGIWYKDLSFQESTSYKYCVVWTIKRSYLVQLERLKGWLTSSGDRAWSVCGAFLAQNRGWAPPPHPPLYLCHWSVLASNATQFIGRKQPGVKLLPVDGKLVSYILQNGPSESRILHSIPNDVLYLTCYNISTLSSIVGNENIENHKLSDTILISKTLYSFHVVNNYNFRHF